MGLNRTNILSACCIAGFFMISCGNELEQIDLTVNADSLPELSAQDIEVIYSDSAQVKMKLVAPQLEKYSNRAQPFTVMPKGVDVEFYNEKMKVESSLKADYAYYDETTDLWEYKGGVRIVNYDGDTLTTEHLFVNRQRDSIYSDQQVSINFASGRRMTGKEGFNADMSFKRYVFKGVTSDSKKKNQGGWDF